MINICSQCGLYRADKIIDPAGPDAICPECGHRHRFQQQPLLAIGGASGSGKTAVCNALTGQVQTSVLLDADIIWRVEFNQPENNYRNFFETWLRVAKNIGQSGRPVVLFGAGLAVPDNLEACVERRYFSTIHYLALVCSDDLLAELLRSRPAWRNAGDDAFIQEHQRFNRWLIDYQAQDQRPDITRLDTSQASLNQTVAQVAAWIDAALASKSG